jgi:hypothetical protein
MIGVLIQVIVMAGLHEASMICGSDLPGGANTVQKSNAASPGVCRDAISIARR